MFTCWSPSRWWRCFGLPPCVPLQCQSYLPKKDLWHSCQKCVPSGRILIVNISYYFVKFHSILLKVIKAVLQSVGAVTFTYLKGLMLHTTYILLKQSYVPIKLLHGSNMAREICIVLAATFFPHMVSHFCTTLFNAIALIDFLLLRQPQMRPSSFS